MYTIKGDWQKYFRLDEEFWIEYSEDVSNVPKGIAIIPLLCNILPMAWVFDAEIIVDSLDKDFYESIDKFKNGYIKMYPEVLFKGTLTVGTIEDNSFFPEEKTAAFFSGGVDAFSTLISHANEKPTLVTIWGADIFFNDIQGWKNVQEHVLRTAREFGTKNLFIKSCFRRFLKEGLLSNYIFKKAHDGWWRGFQHGIGLIGHVAPYAYQNKLKAVYIASSLTKEEKVTCASDPTIDNFVKMSSCTTIHDGYEYTRQDKIRNICEYKNKNSHNIILRVCWQSKGGMNCCACEKCYRTIYGIIAEKSNPKEFGFDYTENQFTKIEQELKNKIHISHFKYHWKYIQNRFIENQSDLTKNKNLEWIYTVNFDTINNSPMKQVKKIIKKLLSR